MKEKTKQLQTFILSLMMLIMGAAGAWADSSTVITQGTANATTWTNGNFTVNIDNGTGQSGSVKLGHASFTISTSGSETITGASISYGQSSKESPTKYTLVVTTSEVTDNTGTRTWSVSTTSNVVTITNTSNDNAYIGSVTVYYTGGTTPTTTTLTVSPDEGSVYVGKTLDIHGYVETNSNATVTYTSSNASVATVTSAGVISGVAAGSTTITVSQAANASYTAANETFTINVNAAPTQYTITLAANDNDMGYVTAIYNVADDYNDKAVNDEFTSGTKVSSGTRLTITAHPNTGYEFNKTANPYVDGGVTKYKPWGNATGSTNATFTTATLDNGDKTYIAHFKAKTYTITLDGNGATTAGSANTTATYDSSTLTAITAPTKTDYNLTGYWTSTSGGEMIIDAGGELQASTTYTDGSGNWKHDGVVTLHAQWESAAAPTYSVTYHNNLAGASGSVTDGSTYEAGASVKTQANSFSKSGYTFLGWSTSSGYQSSYTTAGNNVTMVAGGLDLYAQWQIDGSISSSPEAGSTVKAGDAVYTSATTSATGVSQMYIAQGSGSYNAETLKSSGNLVGISSAGWSVSGGATLGTNSWVLSALLTDGTFYSDVLTNTFSVDVAPPVISCSNNTVTITCDTDGASIYYTTNGDTPTSGSTPYSSTPFGILENCTVKAIAIKDEVSSAVSSQECVYGTSITDLPVTIDFGASPFEVGMSFAGASGKTMSLTQNSHEVYFHGSNTTEFSIVSGEPNALRMNSNGATNHFIAIPMSNINGRIDIEVWAPYTDESNFTIRAVLDTGHGTTVQSAAPNAIKTAALDVNNYSDSHFYFRMKDLTATSGVLYIGPASSSYKDYQKIKVTSPTHYLIPDKASVFMGDGSEPETVTITNYSAYPVLLKTVPSYVTATFEPSTGVLIITPKAIGSGGAIELAVDTNGDGEASDVDLSIPVTVTGITIGTQPVSKVYKEGGPITALSVSATNSGEGELKYQWYKNTVNSTTGGEKVGSNSASYTPSLTAEANAFYYCEVSADGAKTKTSDVAYVLYSNTKRYFQMSNVAGNKETATNNEKITGEIIAGGNAYVQTGETYRYITRQGSAPHMYSVNNDDKYIKVVLANAIGSTDVISATINGLDATNRGIRIYNNDLTKSVTLSSGTDSSIKTYAVEAGSALDGETTLYIKGIAGSLSNYFTDLIISQETPLAVSAPTPASQSIQTGDTPAAISVTATGGSGNYTYQWYSNSSSASTSGATPISGATNASYIPTATSGTTYYYCLVNTQETPTGYASVTFTALEHGYLTLNSGDFDDNKKVYVLDQSNYNLQYYGNEEGTGDPLTPTSTTRFWSKGSSVSFESVTCTRISSTADNYIKLQDKDNQKTTTIFVKGATSFDMVAGNGNNTSRTVKITVDGVVVGTLAQNLEWSSKYTLNSEGSKITIDTPSGDKIYLGGLRFYQKAPATITVLKNGEAVTEATQYMGDGATEYEVETNGDGSLSLVKPTGATDVTNGGYRTTYAEVTLNDGILSVTPLATTPTNPSTPEVITINHTGGTGYADASTTLNVTVKKHTLALAFSYDKASFKASTLTSSSVIPSGSLPTLKAYKDGVEVTGAAFTDLGIRYMSDDITIGSFASPTSYAITYGGGQGGARIYAYVGSNANVSSAKAYFDLVVEDGTSNALPSTAQAGSGDDKQIYEQKQFRMANSQGVEVVRLTYGGYKYGAENGWRDAEKKGEYYIDGYPYYTRHGMDALDEYGYQLRGMSDEEAKPSSSTDKVSYYEITRTKVHKDDSSCTFNVNKYGNQNVGSHKFWYASGEGGTTGDYQRIHPFTLPTRGGYLKFEPKQTGKLTVYVWQNGVYSGEALGSKPRLGYWFDQDGWVQHPTVVPVTKQPLSKNMGSDHINLTNFGNWKTAWKENGDDAIKPLLTNKWCSIEKPNWENALTATYRNDDTQPTGYYENPFYWMTESEIGTNLNEEETIISKKMTPVPFHNGYMVPEASYLKYVLNVVAGKTYYFYGMMTKIGYVGMNFVQDEVVKDGDGYTSVAETLDVDHQSSRHLNATDDMSWVSDLSHNYTVYDEVTLPSNYKKGQWSTICLPFALSESQVEEAFGKGTQLTIYNGAIKKGTGVYTVKYLSHVDRNILAGQPYFIKPSGVDAEGNDLDKKDGVIGSAVDGASGTRITFNTVVIDKAHFSTSTNYGSNKDVNASGTDIDQYGYEFVGSTNNDKLPTYSYIVSKGELRRFTGSTSKIPTYYAYLKPNTDAARSGSYSMDVPFTDDTVETAWVIDGGDDPTDVISMEAITDAMNNGRVITNGKAYNMMGQEIDPTSAKGIVIINGKKYMFE